MNSRSIGQKQLGFKLGVTSETITSKSGLTVFQETALAAGVVDCIKEKLPAPGSNRGIRPEEYVMPLALMFCGGGRTMEDIREVERDRGLRELCGFRRVPSADAIGTWLKMPYRISGMRQVNQHLCRRIVARSGQEEFTLDTDATLVETEKRTAKMSYKGFRAFAPLLSFLSELELCVACDYRHGNVPAGVGIKDQLVRVHKSLKSLGKRLRYFRSDSAGYQAEVINTCEEFKVVFTITADQDCAVKEAVAGIPKSAWRRLHDAEGGLTDREYAATVHCMTKTGKSFTLVVLRWRNGQQDLFDSNPYRYHCIATNDYERTAEEVIWFHNQRGTAENYNKELKSGFGMGYVPCGSIRADAVYFEIGILAHNLVVAVKRVVLGGGWAKKTIATLRWQLIFIAGKVVRHGRELTLRVAEYYYRLLTDIRAKLVLSLAPD